MVTGVAVAEAVTRSSQGTLQGQSQEIQRDRDEGASGGGRETCPKRTVAKGR